ncbi:hypothetical protein Ahy_A04g020651 isoform A [Arachis hypogaea]|uniref:MOSC domain-containing protein n=1 Tax=Arachis hypogaea TaxID=3818 RepID=A0A445DI60_ARAHY|nr:hypothetical protein Ahy_A04g020651 isoform A [Arachis hypogaea]
MDLWSRFTRTSKGLEEQESSSPSQSEPTAKISSIFIYPIKSCRGISVSKAPLTPTGFKWDRNWLVVNSRGRAYTQRVEPKLALVEVELPTEAFDEGFDIKKDSFMVLKAPGMQPLNICLSKPHEVADGVSVWEWNGSAWDEGAEASQWFSDYLGKPSRLVRFNNVINEFLNAIQNIVHVDKNDFPKIPVLYSKLNYVPLLNFPNTDSQVRPVDPDYAKGHQIMFSDCFPFLLASQESLDAVNQHLEDPVPINRFRPNCCRIKWTINHISHNQDSGGLWCSILVEGCEPFSEDLWTEIKISSFSFLGVKLCSRCKVPSINQVTAISEPEPNQTLMKIRSGKVLRPKGKDQNKTYFGQNMVWNWRDCYAKRNGNVLNVGDPVYVMKKVTSAAEAAA